MTVLRVAVVGLIVALVPTMLDARGAVAASRPSSTPSCLATPSARVILIGTSVQGRPIRAYRIGDVNEPLRFLVVGAIAGDEPGGVAAAHDLLGARPVGEVVIWVILTVNPDGLAAGVRQNAHGVDLNRNFPWHWRRLGSRGFRFYAGPRPLSEPESRATRLFIEGIRPDVTIWFHQPYGLVERRSDASLRIEQRFAALIKLPLLPLPPLAGIANRLAGQDASSLHRDGRRVVRPVVSTRRPPRRPGRDRLGALGGERSPPAGALPSLDSRG